MTGSLIRKLLRDITIPLSVVIVLLAGYQCLWAKITDRISGELLPMLVWLAKGRNISVQQVEETIFAGPGRILKTMLGGEQISFFRVSDMLTIAYVHPVVQTIFCIWAVGRASSAIAGEIDRGTMELLLAQPLARFRVVLAHLCLDLLTIPLLCLSMWGGLSLGIKLVDLKDVDSLSQIETMVAIDPSIFGPPLWNVGALLFAVSGYTMCLSAWGRSRGRVLGLAVLITLLQFLINVVGQLWDAVAPLRPFTVFYYYQPQQIILQHRWTVGVQTWNGGQPLFSVNVLVVLLGVGAIGYGLALWKFCHRDLPAPL
jgi:ABC-2 type transport system permease protein